MFIIYGAGGHAKVVLDALLASTSNPTDILLVDDCIELVGSMICGHTVMPSTICATMPSTTFHVAIGSGLARQILYDRMTTLGHFPQSIIHPKSVISPLAQIGAGVFVAAQSVVAPHVTIGNGAIVNHGAIVDHDCQVGQFSHIAPNAILSGGVKVGNGVLVGAGSVILPGCAIANDVLIGAGAVVTSSILNKSVVVGIPARDFKKGF